MVLGRCYWCNTCRFIVSSQLGGNSRNPVHLVHPPAPAPYLMSNELSSGTKKAGHSPPGLFNSLSAGLTNKLGIGEEELDFFSCGLGRV